MSKWEMVRLVDVCEVVSGTTPSTRNPELWDGDVKWIAPAEISDDSYFIYDTVKHISEKAGLNPMPVGTVLLSSRAPIGKVAIAGSEMCCNQGFKNLICSEKMHNRYLYRFLKSKTEYLNSLGRGATFKEISKPIVEQIQIPLPPLSVQQKIADVLDKASALIEKRKAQIDKLDLLIKSKFIEMFGDPVTNPKGWKKDLWPSLFNTTTGKLDSNAMNANGEYPFFTCAKEAFWIDTYAFDCEALILAGNNAAGIYDVKHYSGKFNAYQRTYVLTLKSKDNQYSVYKYLLELKLEQMRYSSKGTNTKYLTLGILNKLEFIIPPITHQNEFAAYTKQVDERRSMLQQSLEKLELNYKSLMQKCFRGEVF